MTVNHQNEVELFITALELPTPEERRAYVRGASKDNDELYERVLALMESHDQSLGPLDIPPTEFDNTNTIYHSNEGLGQQIGAYKLLEVIGEGGMGTVYMAEQTEPVKRRVALKLIKTGMDTRQVVARFEAERQALALMDHPNIAKVHDAGATDAGRPYFVMELVKGKPITEFCDEQRLDTESRLKLFQKVCQAVQHAHQKGIIHRDLKPSNVMVAMYDDQPVPKVIDFGVAKATGDGLTGQTMFTRFGQIVGTLEYMSPEQAQFNNLDIDTRSDIYSLGAILYELLSGEPPFEREKIKSQALDETLRMIREDEPTKPSTKLSGTDRTAKVASNRKLSPEKLGAILRGDLDWVVMKALEKDRTRRYETASALAADVGRFLDNEPVSACPPSTLYRLRKFARRNKFAFTSASLITVGLVALIVGLGVANNMISQREQQKQNALDLAEQRLSTLVMGNEIITAIFADLNIDEIRNGTDSLEGILGSRLINAGKQLTIDAVGDPLIVAKMQNQLGDSLFSLGFVDEALELYEKSWASRRNLLGANHQDSIESAISISSCYGYKGQAELSLSMLEEVLVLASHNLGAGHKWTLQCMSDIAVCQSKLGKWDKAIPMYEKSLTLEKTYLGEDDPQTVRTMGNLASCYCKAGRLDEGLDLFERVLVRMKAKFGADHKATLKYMRDWAGAYREAGELNKALSLLEETLKLQKAKLPSDHPELLETVNAIAATYWSMGQLDKSVPLFEDLLSRQEGRLGRDHPDVLRTIGNLAVNYRDAGRVTEAVPLLEEVYGSTKQTRLFQFSNTGLTLLHTYAVAGMVGPAKALAKELVNDLRMRIVPNSLEFAHSLAFIGEELVSVEAYAEAEPLLEECLEIRERMIPDDWPTFNAMSMLGNALLGQQKYVDAEPLLLSGYRGLVLRESSIPPFAQARITQSLQRVVKLYESWDRDQPNSGIDVKVAEWQHQLEQHKSNHKTENIE